MEKPINPPSANYSMTTTKIPTKIELIDSPYGEMDGKVARTKRRKANAFIAAFTAGAIAFGSVFGCGGEPEVYVPKNNIVQPLDGGVHLKEDAGHKDSGTAKDIGGQDGNTIQDANEEDGNIAHDDEMDGGKPPEDTGNGDEGPKPDDVGTIDANETDGGVTTDANEEDSGATTDANVLDSGNEDTGVVTDANETDGAVTTDANEQDAGNDDTGATPDANYLDGGVLDANEIDVGMTADANYLDGSNGDTSVTTDANDLDGGMADATGNDGGLLDTGIEDTGTTDGGVIITACTTDYTDLLGNVIKITKEHFLAGVPVDCSLINPNDASNIDKIKVTFDPAISDDGDRMAAKKGIRAEVLDLLLNFQKAVSDTSLLFTEVRPAYANSPWVMASPFSMLSKKYTFDGELFHCAEVVDTETADCDYFGGRKLFDTTVKSASATCSDQIPEKPICGIAQSISMAQITGITIENRGVSFEKGTAVVTAALATWQTTNLGTAVTMGGKNWDTTDVFATINVDTTITVSGFEITSQ